MTIREWWNAKGRALEQKNARDAAAVRQRRASAVHTLRDLSDDELIARAEARTSLSHPYSEMEMQRRLKDSIERLTSETEKARKSAGRWSMTIAALTIVLVVLTVTLIVKG